jgi:hypothetical protein
VKWILDGTPVERLALMRQPYADRPGWHGRANFPFDTLRLLLRDALARGEQPLLHAVGDSTIALVVAAMRAEAPDSAWRRLRPRLEHADALGRDQIAAVKALGIVVVQNPLHLAIPDMVRARWGADRLARLDLLRTLVDSGVPLAIGSDGPFPPGLNLLLATQHPNVPAEALTREQAVAAYTRGSAYAEFAERDKGNARPRDARRPGRAVAGRLRGAARRAAGHREPAHDGRRAGAVRPARRGPGAPRARGRRRGGGRTRRARPVTRDTASPAAGRRRGSVARARGRIAREPAASARRRRGRTSRTAARGRSPVRPAARPRPRRPSLPRRPAHACRPPRPPGRPVGRARAPRPARRAGRPGRPGGRRVRPPRPTGRATRRPPSPRTSGWRARCTASSSRSTPRLGGLDTRAAEAMARALPRGRLPGRRRAGARARGASRRRGTSSCATAARGGAGAAKPILLLAHLDVVAANRADWPRDPFVLHEENGYFLGRGTADDKAMAAIFVANLLRYKREGWRPPRDLVLALTADEEGGDANGVEYLVANHRALVDAAYAINEGGGGVLLDGRPTMHTVQAAEKVPSTSRSP